MPQIAIRPDSPRLPGFMGCREEARWNKAQRLRKQRARARQRKLEAARVYETL